MITSIETLSQEREYFIGELKKMNDDYSLLQNKHSKTNTPETKIKVHQHKQSSGQPSKISHKETLTNKESHMTAPIRNKILFVSGYHGKGMINWLLQITQYNVQSIRKPGARDEELVQTAITNGKDLSKNDFIVIWFNKTNANVLESFVKKLQHTQVIILSEPYRYDINVNQNVYNNNLNFYKKLHCLRLDNAAFLDCNSFIRRSNYTGNGFGLKSVVGRYLAVEIKNIMNLMKIKIDKASGTPERAVLSQENKASARVSDSFLE